MWLVLLSTDHCCFPPMKNSENWESPGEKHINWATFSSLLWLLQLPSQRKAQALTLSLSVTILLSRYGCGREELVTALPLFSTSSHIGCMVDKWEDIPWPYPSYRHRYTPVDGYISKFQSMFNVSHISAGVTLCSSSTGYKMEDSLQWMDPLAQNMTSVFRAALCFPWCNFVLRFVLRSSVEQKN